MENYEKAHQLIERTNEIVRQMHNLIVEKAACISLQDDLKKFETMERLTKGS